MKRSIIATVLGLLVGLLTIVSPTATSGAATTGFRAFAWGANDSGQLGGVPTTKRSSPVQIGTATNWVSISAGGDHTLGVKTDGTLWAWGNNNYGQLGDGTATQRTSPVQVGTGTNWVSISAGGDHTLGVKTDGTLWAWGNNGLGQLGDGTTTNRTSPVQIGTDTNWESVTAGSSYSLGLKTDGTLWAWGYNGYGQLGDGTTTDRRSPVQVGTDTNWASISAGGDHTLGVKTDGTLWAWGNNDDTGWLGDGTTTNRTSPVQIGTDTNWESVTAGSFYSLGLKTDGTLWAWGYNGYGRLGDGTTTNRTSPVQIGTATDWKSIAAGSEHSLGLKTDGTLWAWGYNGYGRLGDGTTTNRTSPVQIGTTTKWASVTAGNAHSFGLREDPIGPPFTPSPAFTSPNPTGSFDLATQFPDISGGRTISVGVARIAGWALDPESPEPIPLHIYVDGAFAGSLDADTDRPDVGQAFPGYGNAHGFDGTVGVPSGFHTVCAYGINIGSAGTNSLVGCRWVMIETTPFGSFDLATPAPGGARIAGWALNPVTHQPIALHIYVDGAIAAYFIANTDRPDVGQAFPGYGNAHGFDGIFGIQPGFHTVCAYGIGGDNPLLGCRWVMIESNPFGKVDVAQSVNGGIQVGGWAIDHQTADSIEIHVYVDGAIAGSFLANGDRPDVGRAFPGYGNVHGFDNVIAATPGPHQVCVYGINKLAGENALVGCRNT